MSRKADLYKKLVSDCLTFNLKYEAAINYIESESGHRLSERHYYTLRRKLQTDESHQLWLNQFTRIGFVKTHRMLLDDAEKVYKDSLNRYYTESNKDLQDKELIIKLENSYREQAKLVNDLSAGTPIIAALKAKLQGINNKESDKEDASRNSEISEGVIIQQQGQQSRTNEWV